MSKLTDRENRALVLGLWSAEAIGDRLLCHVALSGLSAAMHHATRQGNRRLRRSVELLVEVQREPSSWLDAGHRALRGLEQLDAQALVLGDAAFPTLLAASPSCPPVLTVRGNVDALGRGGLAVVGTRRASSLGRKLCRVVVDAAVSCGAVVLSGGAEGIDTTAHYQAMESGGETVLVCGTGIDRVFPASNRALFARVPERGAVVAQYPPCTPGRRGRFPKRNATIAGLADASVVMESPHGSGALHTAAAARRAGRAIWVVAGPAFDAGFSGGFELVRQRTASLVTGLDDMARVTASGVALGPAQREIPLPMSRVVRMRSARSESEHLVLGALSEGPCTRDELAATGLHPHQCAEALLDLELDGLVERGSGERYTLSERCLLARPLEGSHRRSRTTPLSTGDTDNPANTNTCGTPEGEGTALFSRKRP